ncbi:four helix bundle protein [bacterium]|nr:four helix bundle protein [bacterium]
MHNHRNLTAYKLAKRFAHSVYDVTEDIPRYEQYNLGSQLRRSALSIPSNIVEGCGRDTDADFIRFLIISHGSAKEAEFQLEFALERGFINNVEGRTLLDKAAELSRVIHGLIKSYRA